MNYNPPPVAVQFSALAEVEGAQFDKAYREILRVPSMSAGLYILKAGAVDSQQPHHEDEMYYVVRGRGKFVAEFVKGSHHRDVCAGSVIFVAAEVEHRFYDITEELAVLVFFAPAES